MEKDYLDNLVSQGLTSYQIADHLGIGQTAARYWIKKHGLRLLGKPGGQRRQPDAAFYCAGCSQQKEPSDFYYQKNVRHTYCKDCHNTRTVTRQRDFKAACLDYKGGSCEACGYDTCAAALEFHHRDPKEKDFDLSRRKLKRFDDTVRAELDKCLLLCCRCHREAHAGLLEFGASDGS
jgi:hypothetical protein